MSENCTICGSQATRFAEALVLRRHNAVYYLCGKCGLVFAHAPHWLDEAYSDAIAEQDIGLPTRSVNVSRMITLSLRLASPCKGPYLDFGAGNGLLVRLMRDVGADFRYFDIHGTNHFAKGFEVDPSLAGSFALVSAIEVLEHLVDPVRTLSSVTQNADYLIATTLRLPEPTPLPTEWWYYALATGQHVTLYTDSALDELAKRLGFVRTSHGAFHLFSRKRVSRWRVRVAASATLSHYLFQLARRRSLVDSDYEQLFGQKLISPLDP